MYEPKPVQMRVKAFRGHSVEAIEALINAFLSSLDDMIVPDIQWAMVMDPTIGELYSALVRYYPR